MNNCQNFDPLNIINNKLKFLEQQIANLNNAIYNTGFNTSNSNALIKVGSESTSIKSDSIQIKKGSDLIEMNPKGFFFKSINLLETTYFFDLIIQQKIDIQLVNLFFSTPITAFFTDDLSSINTQGFNTAILYFSLLIPEITTFYPKNDFLFSINSNIPYSRIYNFFNISDIIDRNFNIIITLDNISSLLQYNYFSFTPMVYGESLFYNNWFNISFNSFQLMANLKNSTKKIIILYTLSIQIYKKFNYYEDDTVFIYVFYLSTTYLSSYNIWHRLFYKDGTIFAKINHKINYIPNFLISTYFKELYNIDSKIISFMTVSDNIIKKIIGNNLFKAQNVAHSDDLYENLVNNTYNQYTNNIIYANFSNQNNNTPPNGVWTQKNVFDLYFDIPDQLYNNSQKIYLSGINNLILLCFNPQQFGLNFGNIILYNATGNLKQLFTIQTTSDLPILNDSNYPSTVPLQPPSSDTIDTIGYYSINFDNSGKMSISPTQEYNIIQVYTINVDDLKNAYPSVNEISFVERQSYPSCVLNEVTNYYEPQTLSYFSGELQNYYGGQKSISSYGNKQVYCPISMRVLTM